MILSCFLILFLCLFLSCLFPIAYILCFCNLLCIVSPFVYKAVYFRKRPLGRPRRRWEDNIKMDLQEVGRGCGDWMEMAHDRDRWRALVNTVMNFGVVP